MFQLNRKNISYIESKYKNSKDIIKVSFKEELKMLD